MQQADQVQFLKVAKTFMKKALARLSIKTANISEVIELADGDIRSAINTIKFNSVVTNKQANSCSALDSQLLLFRALGRILNSKRELTKEEPIPSLPTHLRRNTLTYVPEDQCTLSGFMPSTFSSFLHQNMSPFIPDISTHDRILEDMSLSDLFSSKYGHMEKLADYQAVISSRSLAYWNHTPVKNGFMALHRPKSIEQRKVHQQNQAAIGAAKFNAWHGASTSSLVTQEIPAFVLLSPRHHLSLQFGDLTKFPRYTSHNGARLVNSKNVWKMI